MKYKRILKCLVVIFLAAACHTDSPSFSEKYYKTNVGKWKDYLHLIGFKNSNLSRSVIIIFQSGDCAPCLKELDWWNNHAAELDSTSTSIIIIEKYVSTFHAFIKEEDFSLPAYQDSSGLALQMELIPTTPVKIYFNRASKITAINKVGEEGDLRTFLDKMRVK